MMPFWLKNAPSDFQNIMNEIFNSYTQFCTVFINDLLIFSQDVTQYWSKYHKKGIIEQYQLEKLKLF